MDSRGERTFLSKKCALLAAGTIASVMHNRKIADEGTQLKSHVVTPSIDVV